MNTIVATAKRYKWLIAVALLIAGGSAYTATRPAPAPAFETAEAKRTDVVQEVSVTGRVETQSQVDLSFERGGRVSRVFHDVGGRVTRGAELVRLDASELDAQLAQANANIAFEVARLEEITRGTREEDIRVAEARVASAASSVVDARNSLIDKMSDALTKGDDALFNKTDHLFDNPRTSNPQIRFPISDQKLEFAIESARVDMTSSQATLTVIEADAHDSALAVRAYLEGLRAYLDKLASAINSVSPSSAVSQASIDSWKADVSTARTNVNAALTGLVGAAEKSNIAESALVVAKEELAAKRAGALPETIAAQEAKIVAMQAQSTGLRAQIAKMSLIAPISGVVTKQEAKVGETVSANQTIVVLASDGKFKIEANIPEVDVAKIKKSDRARVTLDAYGSDAIFDAEVSLIDPAETIVQGVPTYKVTLVFLLEDVRIKKGMTANIDISTATREGVIAVPSRSIATNGSGKFVKVLRPGMMEPEEVKVETGLRGSDGLVEILEGLSEGDKVVTFEREE